MLNDVEERDQSVSSLVNDDLPRETSHMQTTSTQLVTTLKCKTVFQAAQLGDYALLHLFFVTLNPPIQPLQSYESSIHAATDSERHATALHWCCFEGHDDCVALLLKCGSRLTYVPPSMKQKQSAFLWACISGKLNVITVCVQQMIAANNLESLLCNETSVDSEGCSPYMLLVQNNHHSALHYLLRLYRSIKIKEEGEGFSFADHLLNEKNNLFVENEGHSLLAWAAHNGDYNMVKYLLHFILLSNGDYQRQDQRVDYAKIWKYITFVDKMKRSVFHWLARRGHVQTLQLVVRFSVVHILPYISTELPTLIDVLSWKDSSNMTALEQARAVHHTSIVNLLRAVEANYSNLVQDISSLEDLESTQSISVLNDNDRDDTEQALLSSFTPNTDNKRSVLRSIRANQEESPNKIQQNLFRVIGTAAMVILFPWILNYLSVPLAALLTAMYIAFFLQLLRVRSRFTSQETRDGFLLGLYFGFYSSIVLNYYFYMYPILREGLLVFRKWWYLVQLIHVFVALWQIVSLITYVFLVFICKNPGFINNKHYCISSDDEEILRQWEKGMQVNENRYCATCMVKKPLRSKHDAVTNRCIANYDHYCAWMQMPIGRDNHVVFIVFLIATMMFGLFIIFMSFLAVYLRMEAFDTPSFVYALFYRIPFGSAICVITATVLAVPVTMLALTQIRNVLFKLTTNEIQNYARYPWIVPLRPYIASPSENMPRRVVNTLIHNSKFLLRGGVVSLLDQGYQRNIQRFVVPPRDRSGIHILEYSCTPKGYITRHLQKQGIRVPTYVDRLVGTQYEDIEMQQQYNN